MDTCDELAVRFVRLKGDFGGGKAGVQFCPATAGRVAQSAELQIPWLMYCNSKLRVGSADRTRKFDMGGQATPAGFVAEFRSNITPVRASPAK
jgi:hypothetical protein